MSTLTGFVRRPINMAFGRHPEATLLDLKTKRYKSTIASIPAWAGTNGWGAFSLGTVDEMQRDWQVRQAYAFKLAPLFTAEFEFEASSPEVQRYAEEMMATHWEKSLGVSLESVRFGYAGDETVWKEENGLLKYDGLMPLHPRDVRPFTQNGKLAFVRLKNNGSDLSDAASEKEQAPINLEGATKNIPGKGLWVTHDATYNKWYGRSAYAASWYPWRLKTMPDGAVETIVKAYYKHGFGGMVIRHPDEMYQDSGSAITSAQDYARQMGEQVKSGANFALSNRRDAAGEYEWNFEKMGGDIVADFGGLIAYPDWLDKLIVRGMEIPDEIITHDGNTGGFSRSNIAFLAFLIIEERILNDHVRQLKDQIIDPAIRFNYGEQAWVKIKPKPLLPDPSQQQGNPNSASVPGIPGMPAPPPPSTPGAGQPLQMSRWTAFLNPETGRRGWRSEHGRVLYQSTAPGSKEATWHRRPAHWTVGAHFRAISQRLKSLPSSARMVSKAVYQKAKDTVTDHYQRLETKFGRPGALAILGATVLMTPIPVPGSSLIPIVVAGIAHRLMRSASPGGAVNMGVADMVPDVIDFIQQVYTSMGVPPPDLKPETVQAALAAATQPVEMSTTSSGDYNRDDHLDETEQHGMAASAAFYDRLQAELRRRLERKKGKGPR